MICEELRNYASPRSKLSRMVKNDEIFPVVKGLYETDKNTPAIFLAGSIYGPSYISFEYALGYYGMIPEAVYAVTSAAFEKRKTKRFETLFGTFIYRDIPSEAFPLGLCLVNEGEYYYRMATPEKALCDMLYTLPPVSNAKELYVTLTEDLRIEEDTLQHLDAAALIELTVHYHSTNLKKLCTLVRRRHRYHEHSHRTNAANLSGGKYL